MKVQKYFQKKANKMAKDVDFTAYIEKWMVRESTALCEKNKEFIRAFWASMPQPMLPSFILSASDPIPWAVNVDVVEKRSQHIQTLFRVENWVQNDPALLPFWDQLRAVVMSYQP